MVVVQLKDYATNLVDMVDAGANNSYDLGSTSLGWRNVYMNDLNLSNMEGNKNDVDGSWVLGQFKRIKMIFI